MEWRERRRWWLTLASNGSAGARPVIRGFERHMDLIVGTRLILIYDMSTNRWRIHVAMVARRTEREPGERAISETEERAVSWCLDIWLASFVSWKIKWRDRTDICHCCIWTVQGSLDGIFQGYKDIQRESFIPSTYPSNNLVWIMDCYLL